jgi:hypothetical protein
MPLQPKNRPTEMCSVGDVAGAAAGVKTLVPHRTIPLRSLTGFVNPVPSDPAVR